MRVREIRRQLVELRDELVFKEKQAGRDVVSTIESAISGLQKHLEDAKCKDWDNLRFDIVNVELAYSLAIEAEFAKYSRAQIESIIEMIDGEHPGLVKSEKKLIKAAQRVIDECASDGSNDGDGCIICNSDLYENLGEHLNCPLPQLAKISGAKMRFPDS